MTDKHTTSNKAESNVAIVAAAGYQSQAEALAERLSVPLIANAELASKACLLLCYTDQGLGLSESGNRAKPVYVDFLAQAKNRLQGPEILAKAVGRGNRQLRVLDATAGLGRDSFVLAQRGHAVDAMERHPIVAALLEDGIERLRQSESLTVDLNFTQGCSVDALLNNTASKQTWDVVVLDPMFPSTTKTALVKKDMQLFHRLVGADDNGEALFAAAYENAKHRVVVKRGIKSPLLIEHPLPSFQVKGKSVRCDIYTKLKLPS